MWPCCIRAGKIPLTQVVWQSHVFTCLRIQSESCWNITNCWSVRELLCGLIIPTVAWLVSCSHVSMSAQICAFLYSSHRSRVGPPGSVPQLRPSSGPTVRITRKHSTRQGWCCHQCVNGEERVCVGGSTAPPRGCSSQIHIYIMQLLIRVLCGSHRAPLRSLDGAAQQLPDGAAPD